MKKILLACAAVICIVVAFFIVRNLVLPMEVEPKKIYGGHTMVGELKKVLVRQPDTSFGEADPQKWHYTAKPDLNEAIAEHKYIVQTLENEGVKVLYSDAPLTEHADAIFVHDPIIMTDFGAIVLKMGKALRQGEEASLREKVKSLNIPILLELHDDATAEGGDILWIDDHTLAIGRGYRTNQEGINQIREALAPHNISVVQVELPCDQGKDACLHLQSLISFVDHKAAVVYKKYLPVSFVQMLEERGIQMIEVPDSEYATMATNILAIKPKVLLMLEGNYRTMDLLKANGCKVYTYKGNEISHKAEGGATCLTRPILRLLP